MTRIDWSAVMRELQAVEPAMSLSEIATRHRFGSTASDLLRHKEPEDHEPLPLTKLDRRWIWGCAVVVIAIWALIAVLIVRATG